MPHEDAFTVVRSQGDSLSGAALRQAPTSIQQPGMAAASLCRGGRRVAASRRVPPRARAERALAARRQLRVARVCGGRPVGTAWASSYVGGDMRWVLAVVLAGLLALGAAASADADTRTNATYFNDAA